VNEIVDPQKQRMIKNTLNQLLTEREITVEEFHELLNTQTKILERLLNGKKSKNIAACQLARK
jgi:predicted transcriptional regulator